MGESEREKKPWPSLYCPCNGVGGVVCCAGSSVDSAGIAQLVEQLICNQQVVGSSPTAGSLLSHSTKGIKKLIISP